MKAKTKKTLIIVLAVAAVAAIVYFVARGKKKDVNSIIESLGLSAAEEANVKAAALQVANYTGEGSWSASQIAADAASMGTDSQHVIVCHAVYAALGENRFNVLKPKILAA